MATRRTSLLLDADLLDRLDRHARRAGTTKTAVISAALEAWLETYAEDPALGFVGVGRSGHGRLSLDTRSIARRSSPARSSGG